MLLHHCHPGPESHASNIRLHAPLICLVPRVALAWQPGDDWPLWKACFPALVQLLILIVQWKVLVGALLQVFIPGWQALPLFLLCPASTRRHSHSNREDTGLAMTGGNTQSCNTPCKCWLFSKCYHHAHVLDLEPAHTCSCHAPAPIWQVHAGCWSRARASHQ